MNRVTSIDSRSHPSVEILPEVKKMVDGVPLQVVVAAFRSADGASQALRQLKVIDRTVLGVREAAVLVRDDENKLEIKESHHVAKGAVIGGVVGGVLGLIAGPVGWVAAGGAAVGALANRLRDSGFPDARLREIGEGLKPGTSALVVVVEQRWVRELEEELQAEAADVVTEALRAEVAAQLDEAAGGTDAPGASTPSPGS